VLGEAIRHLKTPPKVWLQAGAATIYAHRLDEANDEISGVMGGFENPCPETWRFGVDVARAWEGEFALLHLPHTRKVVLRTSLVMNPDRGSVFDYLLGLVRLGLGGTVGSGQQYVSWMHESDYTRALQFLIENETLEGPFNMASPHPIKAVMGNQYWLTGL
jgi:NAD dependent epimerase/dehydratase family enzyme